MTKFAINGFGRIGRLVLRAFFEKKRQGVALPFTIDAVNDLASLEQCAHLFNYDSVHGRWSPQAVMEKDGLRVDDSFIHFCQEKNPAQLPWGARDVSLVLECSGVFTSKDKATLHCEAGAARVLVSAPASEADLTVVYGVNHGSLRQDHVIVSNASCTTNCLVPVVHVLDEAFGVSYGTMTTIHSYTGDQNTVDQLHKDVRRARAAALSMIPTSTGAAKAVGEVLPHLRGRIDGSAVRVPTPNVSLVDFVCVVKKKADTESLTRAMKEAAQGALRDVLVVNDVPLVSSDFNHSTASATVDSHELRVMGGNLCRVLAWYDNEWGFANRMVDVASLMTP